jgi:hypothetical protein
MRIIQERKMVALWNKWHFEEKKKGECAACLKSSVRIFVEKVCTRLRSNLCNSGVQKLFLLGFLVLVKIYFLRKGLTIITQILTKLRHNGATGCMHRRWAWLDHVISHATCGSNHCDKVPGKEPSSCNDAFTSSDVMLLTNTLPA